MEEVLKKIFRNILYFPFRVCFVVLSLPMLPIYWLLCDYSFKEIWEEWKSVIFYLD